MGSVSDLMFSKKMLYAHALEAFLELAGSLHFFYSHSYRVGLNLIVGPSHLRDDRIREDDTPLVSVRAFRLVLEHQRKETIVEI